MSLARPGTSELLTAWSVQPVAVAAAVGAAVWYLVRLRRAGGHPPWRVGCFALGLVAFAWTTNGFPQAYGRSLFWVWLSQSLGLLLVVPLLLLAGGPIRLAPRHGAVRRLAASPFGRSLANPLVGPAIVPLLAFALFFGPVPGLVTGAPPLGWTLQLALVLVGVGITLPLTADAVVETGSLAVGLAMAVGVVELLADAVPGIVLRLYRSPVTAFWDHRAAHAWSPTPLHDQQAAGAVLWTVAELIDLPFLVLVFRRWVRADAVEAARVDSVLEAERVVYAAHDPGHAEVDQPWWLSDPAMRERFRSSRPDGSP